jgi:hypothetical protein
MTQDQHFDVASYALGVLDERDAARFEDHLIDCVRCAAELESFIEVADILADVDADALVATEQSRRDGLVLKNVLGEVKKERRQANSRRLYSLAAAVVVFAMLAIGALFAGGKWFAPDQQQQPPQATQSRGPDQPDPLPQSDGGAGIGGPDLALTGERMGSTDARSGVRLDAALEPKDWGTQVQFAVSNIEGPRTCRLVAVRTDGRSEVLSTWTISDKGWGTAQNQAPLLLSAVTALPRATIAHLQIQSVASNGTTETLVTAP